MKMSQGLLYICVIIVLMIMMQCTEPRILEQKKIVLFGLFKNIVGYMLDFSKWYIFGELSISALILLESLSNTEKKL